MRIFVAKENSDQTEGRGPMRTIGYFDNLKDAYAAVKGRGVMGVGDGEIYCADMNQNPANYSELQIYGYHGWASMWGPDMDEEPAASSNAHDLKDPDYRMYLALKARYE